MLPRHEWRRQDPGKASGIVLSSCLLVALIAALVLLPVVPLGDLRGFDGGVKGCVMTFACFAVSGLFAIWTVLGRGTGALRFAAMVLVLAAWIWMLPVLTGTTHADFWTAYDVGRFAKCILHRDCARDVWYASVVFGLALAGLRLYGVELLKAPWQRLDWRGAFSLGSALWWLAGAGALFGSAVWLPTEFYTAEINLFSQLGRVAYAVASGMVMVWSTTSMRDFRVRINAASGFVLMAGVVATLLGNIQLAIFLIPFLVLYPATMYALLSIVLRSTGYQIVWRRDSLL